MPPRVVMLVDLDYFFAQSEEIKNPSIRDKPVVVCVYSGRTEDSGAVSTANYIARNRGVKSGMPIILAKKRLEGTEAVFLPVNFELYEETSGKIMTLLRAHAERFEQVGIDEAYLDMTQTAGEDFEKARNLAQQIKEEIKAKEELTCSIGVAPNKLLAKIAADTHKPDGLTVVKPEEVQSFLSPLPVNRIVGVGKKTEEKMERLGILTVGDLAKYDPQRLIEIFGKKMGVYFYTAALGIDDEPVQERGEPESISRIATLKENTRDLDAILERTSQLVHEIHSDVLKRRFKFRTVGVVVTMRDLTIHSRSKTLDSPTDDLENLKKTVKELFQRLLQQSALDVRRVGVRIYGFVKEGEKQKQLTSFIDHSEDNASTA